MILNISSIRIYKNTQVWYPKKQKCSFFIKKLLIHKETIYLRYIS